MSQFREIKHTETYPVPSQTAKVFTTLRVNSLSFSGRNVDLFESMLVPQGEGPIAQSKSLTPGADEPASPPRDASHGEAFPTATSLDAGQDKENIPKTSVVPHESSPMVTSLGGDEDILQLKLNELIDFCTKLQSQHSQMAEKIQKDTLNRGGMMDQREDFGIERDSNKSTDKRSESTREMANVLSSMGAANILASRGLKEVFTTASPPVPLVSLFVPTVAATASEKDSIATVITTTTTVTLMTYSPTSGHEPDPRIIRITPNSDLIKDRPTFVSTDWRHPWDPTLRTLPKSRMTKQGNFTQRTPQAKKQSDQASRQVSKQASGSTNTPYDLVFPATGPSLGTTQPTATITSTEDLQRAAFTTPPQTAP
ncbi:hypothetical protein Tco_1450676 [Tanacetum coccineum]